MSRLSIYGKLKIGEKTQYSVAIVTSTLTALYYIPF